MDTDSLRSHRWARIGEKGDGVRTNFELPEGSLCGDLSGAVAIHKVTANGTATSPVTCGVSMMDRLLDDPARSPPPGVPAIDSDKLACAFAAHLLRYETGAEIARIMEIIKAGGHGVRAMTHEPAASYLFHPPAR